MTVETARIADAWLVLAADLGIGSRVDRLTLEVDVQGAARPRMAALDENGSVRLRRALDATSQMTRQDSLQGVLVEADFEKRTARLRTPTGQVSVIFADELADTIQDALRGQSEVEGLIEYDPVAGPRRRGAS